MNARRRAGEHERFDALSHHPFFMLALMTESEARELGLYTRISEMEPMLVESGELEDLAAQILARSAALGAQLPEVTQASMRELLRIINSYYSNLIEGNATHPIDIERAAPGVGLGAAGGGARRAGASLANPAHGDIASPTTVMTFADIIRCGSFCRENS
ncbi:MAG: hypothetical protein WDA20_11255 [Desulfuromonadales bacterium]